MAEQLTFRCDGVERYRTTARGETIDWVASYEACKVKIEELEARVKELEANLADILGHRHRKDGTLQMILEKIVEEGVL